MHWHTPAWICIKRRKFTQRRLKTPQPVCLLDAGKGRVNRQVSLWAARAYLDISAKQRPHAAHIIHWPETICVWQAAA
jgi:hypothetical protein